MPIAHGEGLGTTQAGVIEGLLGRHREQRPIGVDVHQRGADVVQAANGVETDAPRMAQNHQAAQVPVDAREPPPSAFVGDAIFDNEMPAFDRDADAVAGQCQHASLRLNAGLLAHRHFLFGGWAWLLRRRYAMATRSSMVG